MSLYCKGGSRIIREKKIDLPRHHAASFLTAGLEDDEDQLLGGTYQCLVSFDDIRDRRFIMKLESDQDIAVWTVGSDFKTTGTLACQHEAFRNFNRPSEIINDLNSGGSYSGSRCNPIKTNF